MITEDDVRTFRKLCKTHYGVTLSEAEAGEHARRLVTLFKAVYMDRNQPDAAPIKSADELT